MLRFLLPLILILSSATSLRQRFQPRHRVHPPTVQVASESQVKFALENKYDDTGPGAKQTEFAYYTYKTLEDALVAYLDDPDTKLPENERTKAIKKLTQPQFHAAPDGGRVFLNNGNYKVFQKAQFLPSNHGEAEGHKFNIGKIFYEDGQSVGGSKALTVPDGKDVTVHFQSDKKLEPYKFQRLRTVKGSPLSLAHYTRDHEQQLAHENFDPHPKYTFSYGVHDKSTGDIKSAQESRDGGKVNGFYSYIDADGKTHIVHYTADDRQGFRANVQTTH